MFTYDDTKQVRTIVQEELAPIKKQLDKLENNVDKVLKIVTRTDQEHVLTQAKVTKLKKRTRKIEGKLKIASPATTSVFA